MSIVKSRPRSVIDISVYTIKQLHVVQSTYTGIERKPSASINVLTGSEAEMLQLLLTSYIEYEKFLIYFRPLAFIRHIWA